MIIAFSGIGGSGKTTQLAALQKSVGGEFIQLSKEFGLINAFKKTAPGAKPSFDVDTTPGFFKTIKSIALMKYYVIHSWAFAVRNRKKTVLVDRWYDDYLIGLYYRNRISKRVLRLALALVPEPDVHYWFDCSADVVYARKKEHAINVLRKEEKAYEAFSSMNENIIPINADDSEKNVREQVLFFKEKQKKDGVDEFACKKIVFTDSVAPFHKALAGKIINYANAQKCLWPCYSVLKKRGVYSNGAIDDYYGKKTGKINATAEIAGKKFPECALIKHGLGEPGEDVDLFCGKKNGVRHEETRAKTGVGIDVFHRLEFGGVDFFKNETLERLSADEISYLFIALNAVVENGVIRLNDALRMKKLEKKISVGKMARIIRRNGCADVFRTFGKYASGPTPSFIPVLVNLGLLWKRGKLLSLPKQAARLVKIRAKKQKSIAHFSA